MKARIAAALLVLTATPAFSRIELVNITIYFTGVEYLSGRKQIGSLAELKNIGISGEPAFTNWRTIHGFEDAFTAARAESTGVQLSSGSTWKNTFTMVGDYSTCYRARVQALVGDGDENAYGSSQLCTPGRPTETPPCQFRPEGCGGVPVNCPLIVNLGQGPWRLAGLDDAVLFDIDGDGTRDRLGWTERGSALAFVVRDRNGNGAIDDVQELFGDHTLLASGFAAGNGFHALKELDVNGDGVVNKSDPGWQTLSLWTDANHDGVTQAGELRPIHGSGIEGLGTEYHWTGRTDQHGNAFRLQSKVDKTNGREPYYDIFFRVDP